MISFFFSPFIFSHKLFLIDIFGHVKKKMGIKKEDKERGRETDRN